MKASAVTQSFKALASKFNNQVPLGTKESNQLLTAITSSFRKHLDEVHPSQPHHDELEGERRTASKGPRGLDSGRYESSAASADKHMASVLTNPLLVNNATRHPQPRPELDAVTARKGLKNGAEPFDLLESYHAKGFATVEVAFTCMQHFRRSIKHLQCSEQAEVVEGKEAGKRVLAWLYDSGLLQASTFTNNPYFQDGLAWLIVMEGLEDILWRLMESDLGSTPRLSKKDPKKHSSPNYAWQSRMVYAMVETKLAAYREAHSADAALEVYFKALQHAETHGLSSRDKTALTDAARQALVRALVHGPVYSKTNPSVYDTFTRICAEAHSIDGHSMDAQTSSQLAFAGFQQAKFRLWHPSHPTADMWYSIVCRTASDGSARNLVQDHLAEPKDGRALARHLKAFKRAAQLLNTAGKHEESKQVLSLAKELYPSKPIDIAEDPPAMSTPRGFYRLRSFKQRKKQETEDWYSHYFPATT